VSSLDLLPTCLAAAGVTAPSSLPLDGVDLLPFLRRPSRKAPHDQLYWRYNRSKALRQGDWKLVQHVAPRDTTAPWQLFNLRQDIAETQDRSASEPARLKEMIGAWEALNRPMISPLWGTP
jgi:arylsulfatase A-like enzyme